VSPVPIIPTSTHTADERAEDEAVRGAAIDPLVDGDDAGDDSVGLTAAIGRQVRRMTAHEISPGLYLIATPIGNLGDISLRALATLAAVDVVYCEDTRHTGGLLNHYGLRRPLRRYHEHNGERERPMILARLVAGERVALVSDAGTPLISDPGYKLVREVVAAGIDVVALPGASATLAAMTVSGLPSDCFLFAGFLPSKQAARRQRLAELATVAATLVLFESPSRLAASLIDLAELLGPRETTIARELTKRHEEVRRGTLDELAKTPQDWLGEIVLVIAPPPAGIVDDAAIAAALRPRLAVQSVRDAVRDVADTLAVGRSRVYALAVQLRQEDTA
jgi:16S rRNA (cytidine1402-2'-O)-methyltransferase